jgi:hypothetical protein
MLTILFTAAGSIGSGTFTLIQLPQGTVKITRSIYVNCKWCIIRGAGSDPQTGTRIEFLPDDNTRYDQLEDNGYRWSLTSSWLLIQVVFFHSLCLRDGLELELSHSKQGSTTRNCA